MDSLITAAASALAAGDPLAALKRVSSRDDAPALALRGIAMAQLGDLSRAKELLGNATRAFGDKEPMAHARCSLAEAEIALVLRDLGRPTERLGAARATLEAFGDLANAGARCQSAHDAAGARHPCGEGKGGMVRLGRARRWIERFGFLDKLVTTCHRRCGLG